MPIQPSSEGCLGTTCLRGRPSERLLAPCFPRAGPIRCRKGRQAGPSAGFLALEPLAQGSGIFSYSGLQQPRPPRRSLGCRDLGRCLRCGTQPLMGATGATGRAGLIAIQPAAGGRLGTTSLRGRPSERILASCFSPGSSDPLNDSRQPKPITVSGR